MLPPEDDTYETQLAAEGWQAEDEATRLSFEEAFAFATTIDAKRTLVKDQFSTTSPLSSYYNGLCDVLQAQEKLCSNTYDPTSNLLPPSFDSIVKELKNQFCTKKAARLQHRSNLLKLETEMLVSESLEKMQNTAKEVVEAAGLSFNDNPPYDALQATSSRTSLPSALKEEDIDAMKISITRVTEWSLANDLANFRKKIVDFLRVVTDYVKAELFTKTFFNQLNLRQDRRQVILDVLQSECPLEFTQVKGYLMAIAEDVREKLNTSNNKITNVNGGFGYNTVHKLLSLDQLRKLLQLEPTAFKENVFFAIRCIQLIRDHVEEDHQSLMLDTRAKVKREIDSIDPALSFLDQFSSKLAGIRMVLLYNKLELLSRRYDDADAKQMYDALISYAKLRQVNAHLLWKYTRLCPSPIFLETQLDYSASDNVTPEGFDLTDTAEQLFCAVVTNVGEEKLMESVLLRLLALGFMSALRQSALKFCFRDTYLKSIHALHCIQTGQELPLDLKPYLPEGKLDMDGRTSHLTFCKSNPSVYYVDEELVFFICVRNLPSVNVHVYEINTLDYYTRKKRQVESDIHLEGILPNEEKCIDLSHLSPLQEARIPVHLDMKTKGKRGVFVVEVFEKEMTCRAILRKGFFSWIEKITSTGYEVSVLDEYGKAVLDTSASLINMHVGSSSVHMTNATADGIIKFPLCDAGTSSNDRKKALVIYKDDFAFFATGITAPFDEFDLQCDFDVEKEKLCPGGNPHVIFTPQLLEKTRKKQVTMERLVAINVAIEYFSSQSEAPMVATSRENFRFDSIDELLSADVTLSIPNDTDSFSIALSARVKRVSMGEEVTHDGTPLSKLPDVRHSETFLLSSFSSSYSTYTSHLARHPDDTYSILILGHNGEPIPQAHVKVTLGHIQLKEELQFEMQANAQGQIDLLSLDNVTSVKVEAPWINPLRKEWTVGGVYKDSVSDFYCAANSTVDIPVPFALQRHVTEWIQKKQVVLYRLTYHGLHMYEDVTEKTKIDIVTNDEQMPVLFTVHTQHHGEYKLWYRPVNYSQFINVYKETESNLPWSDERVSIENQRSIRVSTAKPLTILWQTLRTDPNQMEGCVYQAKVQNVSKSTRAIIQFRHCLVLQHKINDAQFCAVKGYTWNEVDVKVCEYLGKRRISDEYAYVLQRRQLVQADPASLNFVGASSLPPPSLLQVPEVVSESDMEDIKVRKKENLSNVQNMQQQDCFTSARCMNHMSVGASRRFGTDESIAAFLSMPSEVVHIDFIPDDGIISLSLSDLDFFSNGSNTTFVASITLIDVEKTQKITQERCLSMDAQPSSPLSSAPKCDVSLSTEEALPPDVHYMQQQQHQCLLSDTSHLVSCSIGSKHTLYQDLDSALELWKRLCQGSNNVSDLSEELKQWRSKRSSEKLKMYYMNASDDFHFFLYHKDKPFFDKYAKPLIQSKLVPSFLDCWLLEDEDALRRLYLVPGPFQQMCVIEKILLAVKLSSVEDVRRICHHVMDEIGKMYPNHCPSRKLSDVYQSVISQGAIEPTFVHLDSEVAGETASIAVASAPHGAHMNYQRFENNEILDAPSFPSSADEFRTRANTAAVRSARGKAHTFGGSKIGAAKKQESSRPADDDAESSSDESDYSYESNDDNLDYEDLTLSLNESDESLEDYEEEEVERTREKKTKEGPYVVPGKVRKVREKRFFTDRTPHLDGRNMFWYEYAKHLLEAAEAKANSSEGEAYAAPFISSYFPEALSSLTEGLLAVSLLELPTNPTGADVTLLSTSASRLEVLANDPVILYHQSLGPAACSSEPNTSVIVQQRVVDADSDIEDAPSVEDFVVNKVYKCVVKVTNITPRAIAGANTLMQIPQGSIPLCGGYYTKNKTHYLSPHSTKTETFCFYFPSIGNFSFYPAHVAVDDQVIAWARDEDEECRLFDRIVVLQEAPKVDMRSWKDVAARGSLEDVLTFLSTHLFEDRMDEADLTQLSWRCRDATFYAAIIPFLRERMVFVNGVWKYAAIHGDSLAMREILSSSEWLQRVIGKGVETSLVSTLNLYGYNRIQSGLLDELDHTEFGPFLPRRAHLVKGQVNMANTSAVKAVSILHAGALQTYRSILQRLGQFSKLNAEHLLVLTYYMVLFQRPQDALHLFNRLVQVEDGSKARVEKLVQYGYMAAYLDFIRPAESSDVKFAQARKYVQMYRKHPQPRWRERFSQMKEILDELDAYERRSDIQTATEGKHSEESSTRPRASKPQLHLDMSIEGQRIHITSENIGSCEVSFHPVDPELLFSKDPFGTLSAKAGSGMKRVLTQPIEKHTISLSTSEAEADDAFQTDMSVPEELASRQVLIRVQEVTASRRLSSVAPPMDISRMYFNSKLDVVVSKQTGVVQVFKANVPVVACYVKVYAKVMMPGSSSKRTEFYKDGYTDLLGKFDYVGINGDLISRVHQFAIFCSHSELGTSVKQEDPPVLASQSPDFNDRERYETLLY